MHDLIQRMCAGEDLDAVTTTEDYIVKSASGRIVHSFDKKESVIDWFERRERPDTLRVIRVTRIEEEIKL